MASTNITTFPGKVGVSNANPTHTLSIGSNVFVDDTGTNKLVVLGSISTTGTLSGDGSGISNIQSSNVSDFASNVTRIGTLETDLDDNSSRISTVSTDLSDNSSRISTVSTDLDDNSSRISTVSTDLDDNSSRITVLESGDTNITGKKTFTEQVTFESNIHVKGDLLVANTVNMTVSDPILELGSNNLNTGDIGLVMTRHGASNSNVAVFFDESEDVLKLGYTLNGAGDSTLEFDSNALAVSIQGTLEVDTANVNTINVSAIEGLQTLSFSSDSTTVPPLQLTAGSLNDGVGALRIDSVEPDIFLNDTDGGFSTVTFANNDVARAAFGRNNGDDFYITVRDPATNGGNWRNTTLVVDSSSGNVSMAYGLTVGSNLEVGTANLFVDTTTGNVGVGTNSPGFSLDVHGTSNVGALTATSVSGDGSGLTSLNATNLTSGTVPSARLSLAASDIPSLDAGKITTGTLARPISTTTGTFSGNVGIGTVSPTEILHLAAGSNPQILVEDTGDANRSEIRFKTATTDWCLGQHGGDIGKFKIANNTDVGTGALVTIDQSGNVGIGTTSPSGSLHVQGSQSIFGNNGGASGIVINDIPQARWKISTGGYALSFSKHSSTSDEYSTWSEKVRIDTNGNVGIGTSSPSHPLTVQETTTNTNTVTYPLAIRAISSGTVANGFGAGIRFQCERRDTDNYQSLAGSVEVYGAGNLPGTSDLWNMRFGVRNNDTAVTPMTLRYDGNVGIGTASPGTILSVQGAAESPIQKIAPTASTSTFSFILNAPAPGTTSGGAVHFINGSTRSNDGGQSTYTIRNDNGALNLGNSNHATRIVSNSFEYSNGDGSVTVYGPNTTWNCYLFVGAASDRNPNDNSDRAQVITTNGNLHLDAGGSRDIYMNFYSGNYIRHNGLGVYSDDRLKTDEELITNATETLLKLKPQRYTKAWTLNETELREPHTETGLIAQDIWYDAPELRHIVLLGEDANPSETKPSEPVPGDIQQDPDYSSWGPREAAVNYEGLIAYLIKSNQELYTEIQAEKARNDALEARIAALENA